MVQTVTPPMPGYQRHGGLFRNNLVKEVEPPDTFYCMVDTYIATKDYLRGGRCVRFIGVARENFTEQALQNGLVTYTLDIDYWVYCQHYFRLNSWRDIRSKECAEVDGCEEGSDIQSRWYKIKITPSNRQEQNYLYQTFTKEPPQYFKLQSIVRVRGPAVPISALLPDQSAIESRSYVSSEKEPFLFDSFHVGQGMCSLVHNKRCGVLIDVGAGKPITRLAFLNGSVESDLKQAIERLEQVDLVLSHPDSDHWRMLAWDDALRSKVRDVFVPKNARALALRDRAILSRVQAVGDLEITLSHSSNLSILRSMPQRSDSNGECLVVVFARGEERVLAAGDYVYERYRSDRNPRIAALHSKKFVAVVVPHHGDRASSKSIVQPSGRARAFFSAGTHQGYGHPTREALNAHRKSNFSIISKPKERHIRRVNLL